MHKIILPALAALALLAAVPAQAAGEFKPGDPRSLDLLKRPPPFMHDYSVQRPNVIAPYRVSPPPSTPLTPSNTQRLQTYRRQLQDQMLNLQQQQSQNYDPLTQRRLLETQNELNRTNNLLSQ